MDFKTIKRFNYLALRFKKDHDRARCKGYELSLQAFTRKCRHTYTICIWAIYQKPHITSVVLPTPIKATSTLKPIRTVVTYAGVNHNYVNGKLKEWSDELSKLSKISLTQPHSAYSALTHGLLGRWTFLSRTLPGIGDLFSPLAEQIIRVHLLPTLTGKSTFSDVERQLISLPSRLGGLGINDQSLCYLGLSV